MGRCVESRKEKEKYMQKWYKTKIRFEGLVFGVRVFFSFAKVAHCEKMFPPLNVLTFERG